MKFVRPDNKVLPGDIWQFEPSNNGRIWIVYVVKEEDRNFAPGFDYKGSGQYDVLLLSDPYNRANCTYTEKLMISPNNYPTWKLLVRL